MKNIKHNITDCNNEKLKQFSSFKQIDFKGASGMIKFCVPLFAGFEWVMDRYERTIIDLI